MSMGIQNISEEDLEAYTRGEEIHNLLGYQLNHHFISSSDFSRLVEGHLERKPSTSSATVTSSLGVTPQTSVSGQQHHPVSSHNQAPGSSAMSMSAQHTPLNPTNVPQQPGSAVFKVNCLSVLFLVGDNPKFHCL